MYWIVLLMCWFCVMYTYNNLQELLTAAVFVLSGISMGLHAVSWLTADERQKTKLGRICFALIIVIILGMPVYKVFKNLLSIW